MSQVRRQGSIFARRVLDRLWAVAGAVSVRIKILGIVLGMVLLLGGAITWQVRQTLQNTLSRELQGRGASIARDLAARAVDLLLINDLYGAHQLLQDTLSNNQDVRYAFILDAQGDILVHTFGDGFPTQLLEVNQVAATERFHLQKLATEQGIVWDFAVPIFDGRAGTARLGLSEQTISTTLDLVTRQLLLTTGVVSLLGVGAAMLLTWLITRPILDLVQVTRRVARGDLTQFAARWANDEIGALSASFNAMIRDLAAARGVSATVQKELVRRSRRLAALNQVAETVSDQQELAAMLDKALRCVLGLVNLPAGWIQLISTDTLHTRLMCSVGILLPSPPGVISAPETDEEIGLCGFPRCCCRRLLEDKRPILVMPLPDDCPVRLGQLLESNTSIVGHVAVPIISKSSVLGSLNLACTREDCLSDEDLQLLGAIGQQLGVAVENARLWETIRQKEAARGELLEKIITAQEEERKRIARELHDGAGQALTSLMVGLKVLSGLRSPQDAQQQISVLREIAAETLETMHDLALELRPSVLDDLGLVAAIERYAGECQRRFNLRVDCRAVGFDGRRLPPAVEAALYRITQEALTNVARHSGARQASVLLEWDDGQVRLLVEDNGCGFDTSLARQERKLGLYGMEERATLIGGTFHIESEPGLGTTVVVQVAAPEETPVVPLSLDLQDDPV